MNINNNFCKVCNLVFSNKNILDTHILTCRPNSKSANSMSFYKCVGQPNTTKLTLTRSQQHDRDSVPKILPLTQSSQEEGSQLNVTPSVPQLSQNSAARQAVDDENCIPESDEESENEGIMCEITESLSQNPELLPNDDTNICSHCSKSFKTPRGSINTMGGAK